MLIFLSVMMVAMRSIAAAPVPLLPLVRLGESEESQAAAIGLLASGLATREKCCHNSDTIAASATSPRAAVVAQSLDNMNGKKRRGENSVGARGAKCSTSQECGQSGLQLFCMKFPGDREGLCLPRVGLGGACREDDFCLPGLKCAHPSMLCRDSASVNGLGGFCANDDACDGSNSVCDLDSGRCVDKDEAVLRRAATTVRVSKASSTPCGTIERADCYDSCNPLTRTDVLRCSFCCLDCDVSTRCTKTGSGGTDSGSNHITGPLFRRSKQ